MQIWTKNCVMSNIAEETKGNVKLTKKLSEGLKRPVSWNEYKTEIESRNLDDNNLAIFYLDAFFQGVKRLFVLAFNNTTVNVPNNPMNNTNNRVVRDNRRKYFLPRVNITNYNVLINGRTFYEQSVSDQIKKNNEIRKIATVQGDDYTREYLLDYQYFKDHYQLIVGDLVKKRIRC